MILVNKSPAEDHLLFWMTTYGMIFTVMIAAVSLLVVLFVLQFKNKVNCVLSFMVVAALIIRFFNELEYGISGTRDLLNFIYLKLLYQEKFDTDEKLQSLLSDLKNKDISMDDIMLELAKG